MRERDSPEAWRIIYYAKRTTATTKLDNENETGRRNHVHITGGVIYGSHHPTLHFAVIRNRVVGHRKLRILSEPRI